MVDKILRAATIGQFRYLEIIYQRKQVTVTMMAKLLRLKKPTVSRIIGTLLRKKLIVKIADINDKRIKYLTVTATARKIYLYREKMYELMAKEIASILSESRINDLTDLFSLILEKRKEM